MVRGLRGLGRGLGYDYYDVLAAAGGLQNCDPHDSGCVSRNTQVQDAAEDIWVQNMGAATAGAPMPSFTVTPDASAVGGPSSPFFQNVAPNPVVTFAGQAPETLQQVERTSPGLQPIQSAPIQPKKVAAAPTTPQGAVVQSSSSASTAPGANGSPVPGGGGLVIPSSGFNLSSIPWWGWAAGLGVAFFALKGAK